MRFEQLNLFVDEGMRTLTAHASVVWIVLYRDTKPDGVATASADDIAHRSGISRSTVLRAIKRLQELRMLRVVRRGGLNQGASSYRVFPISAPDEWG